MERLRERELTQSKQARRAEGGQGEDDGPLSWAAAAPPLPQPQPQPQPLTLSPAGFPQLLSLWPDLAHPNAGPVCKHKQGHLSALPNQGKQPCKGPGPALTPKVGLLGQRYAESDFFR